MAVSAVCGNKQQCVDGSDQHRCLAVQLKERDLGNIPIIVEFLSTGDYTARSLQTEGSGVSVTCPETHFWCPEKDFCLPVFVRCNGVNDCPGHEDEEGCDVYTCPGFYRCRASKVCVHVNHVCDDWTLCPQSDDELLCNQTCPPQCTCHGMAFFCNEVFVAHLFPDVRYLDVRGTGMTAHQLSDNHMLIHLSLASCEVLAVSNFTFPNLHSLDLSDNLLTEVSGHHFRHVPQLGVLFLEGNPLTSVFNVLDSNHELQKMHMLDLSRVKETSVDLSLILALSNLRFLNLSHSGVKLLQWNISRVPEVSLHELDLRGCETGDVPLDTLTGLPHLQSLFTDNAKLCCPSLLPSTLDPKHCHVTPDEVSSCDHLLGSETHRVTVVILAVMALIGNGVSFVVRVCLGNTSSLSSGGVVLTHLSVADLGTGLYLTTLGLADHLLAGQYVWQDDTWRRGGWSVTWQVSWPCPVAMLPPSSSPSSPWTAAYTVAWP